MRMYTNEEWQQFEQNLKDYVQHMSTNDMDYDKMMQVYKKVRNQEPFSHLVREYNETYFRELLESLKPWSSSYHPTRIWIQE